MNLSEQVATNYSKHIAIWVV